MTNSFTVSGHLGKDVLYCSIQIVFNCLLFSLSPSPLHRPSPQYRYAKLVQPSQFGGEPCHVQGKEIEPCSPPSRFDCTHEETPLCEGFLCTYTGILSTQSTNLTLTLSLIRVILTTGILSSDLKTNMPAISTLLSPMHVFQMSVWI